jgi:hypothetical protein
LIDPAKILNSFGSNPYYPARKTGADGGLFQLTVISCPD